MQDEIENVGSNTTVPWYKRQYHFFSPRQQEDTRALALASVGTIGTLASSGIIFFPAQMTYIGSGFTALVSGSFLFSSVAATLTLMSYRLVDTYRNIRDTRKNRRRFEVDMVSAELDLDLTKEFGEKTPLWVKYDYSKKCLRYWTSKRKILALPLFFLGGAVSTSTTAAIGSAASFGIGSAGLKSYQYFHHLRQTINDDNLFPDLNTAQRNLASIASQVDPQNNIVLDPSKGIDTHLADTLMGQGPSIYSSSGNDKEIFLEGDNHAAIIEIKHDKTADTNCIKINAPGSYTMRLALSRNEFDQVTVARQKNGTTRLCAVDLESPVADGITRVFAVYSNR